MANTTTGHDRIDTGQKNNAESISSQPEIGLSGAIQMLHSQNTPNNSMPVELHIPVRKPIATGSLTRDELDRELSKGVRSLQNEKGLTADEVGRILSERFGI